MTATSPAMLVRPPASRPTSGAPAGGAEGSYILTRVLAWRPDAVSALSVLAVLLFVVPARNTLAALGPAGRPTFLFGLVLLLLWASTRLHPALARSGAQPVRIVLFIYLCVQLTAYVVGTQRIPDGLESRAMDRAMIIILSMCGIALAAADGIPSRERLEVLLRRIVFGGAIMSVFGILQYAFHFDYSSYIKIPGMQFTTGVAVGARGGGTTRVAGTATHYIEFGTVAAMVLPLAVYRTLHAPTPGARQRAAVAMALLAAAVPLSVSRTAVLSLACVLIVQAVIWGWRRRINMVVLLILGLAAFSAAVPGVLGTLKSLFANYEDDPSYKGRVVDHAAAQVFISERPWLGRGPGTFIPQRYFYLDNQYLGTIITSGYVGLAALIMVMVAGFVTARRIVINAPDEATRDLGQALTAIIAAAAFSSYWFDSFGFPAFSCYFYLVLGVIGALWRLERGKPSLLVALTAR